MNTLRTARTQIRDARARAKTIQKPEHRAGAEYAYAHCLRIIRQLIQENGNVKK